MGDHRIKESFEKVRAYKASVELISLLNKAGFEAYIAGGAVRDALLGSDIHDFDLATSASPFEMKEVFKGFKVLEHGIEFGTLTVVVEGEPYEITTYRGESEYKNSRHPNKVKFIKSKDEDLKRRDFTINAMLYHHLEGLYDPYGGETDLKNKVIKTVGDAKERFREDALRILRMMRFSISLGFDVDEDSLKASKEHLLSLKKLSKERVFSEIEKVLSKKFHEAQFKSLQEFYFKDHISTVKLSEVLSTLEKAYFLSKFEVLVPELSSYILTKKLKKDFDFFKNLSSLSLQKLKINFIKKIEAEGVDDEAIMNFYRMFLDSLSDKNAELFKTGFKESRLKKHPFLDIEEGLSAYKAKYSGKELGDALMKLQVNHFWTF